MLLHKTNPRKSLNKAFLKVKPSRADIENFKTNLIQLIGQTNNIESEEFHKNLVSDFLKNTYYKPNHSINTKGRNDLVIHNGKDAKSSVGVIIEAKKPTNKAEMLSEDNLNAKAFHELVLYYLRERITLKNLEIKHLIATNINEWFVFDANTFEKLFAQNKKLVQQFEDFEGGRLTGKSTDFFYNEIAQPFIAQLDTSVEFTYFDLHDYDKPLRNGSELPQDNIRAASPKGSRPVSKKDDSKLIALFKLFAPEHLLKLPFVNDSNSLDKKFYSELLHIIGLTESKQGGKKVIERHKSNERNIGSLLENAVVQLDSLDKIYRLDKPSLYGDTQEERLFNVGLELSITWVNRILFLKLLEAQLIAYHKGDESYAFLDFKKINNYDDLNSLFFQVLAKKHHERNDDVSQEFAKVPYLNSSLFEPNELEHNTIFISNLRDEKTLPILSSTVLKDGNGKKRKGELNALQYFLEFLEAYDFSSEGAEDIQEDNKTLINASVLGLIFEKINGYKDGSFFTPGFITMYMCRETIRRSVVQKFNDTKGWECKDFADLEEYIDGGKDARNEANEIINSLKICDPAVGSGHFLVSALNELIAIKNDLKILQDREGVRLKEYVFEVVNDELIVTDDDAELFEYHIHNKESQRVQEALFHEKQTLIENCLFGVDINFNSVKICRLRLWIELLKNTYYKNETELETLPNIDINIKCGNSLISRFELDADINVALKKSKWSIDSYRMAVDAYRNAQSKEEKHDMERLITDIKSDFRMEIAKNDPKLKTLSKLNGELVNLTTQTSLFDMTAKEKKDWNKKVKKLTQDSQKLETEVEEIRSNKIYENAFEWRFEFPEVLNDDGDFVGFDAVIGNPPYGLFNKKQNKKIALTVEKGVIEVLKSNYPEAIGGGINAARIFYSFGIKISNKKGHQCMIIPYGVLTDTTSVNLRKHIFKNHSLIKVEAFPERDSTKNRVFEDVKMSTAILLTSSMKEDNDFDLGISYRRSISKYRSTFNAKDLIKLSPELVQIPLTDTNSFKLLNKIYAIESVLKIGDISSCLTGEVDMTFAKKAITKNNKDSIFIKGVQLDKYILKTKQEQISQGEIEFIDIQSFKAICSDKKFKDSKQDRLALQGLSGVNEKYRLKVTIIKKDVFLANSCNYILKPANITLELLLAWLNSSLLNFVFKTRSTSSNVNGYEVDNLPILPSEKDVDLINYTKEILDLKKANPKADTSALESEIDQLIYQLYDLSEEEVKIVEGANS